MSTPEEPQMRGTGALTRTSRVEAIDTPTGELTATPTVPKSDTTGASTVARASETRATRAGE